MAENDGVRMDGRVELQCDGVNSASIVLRRPQNGGRPVSLEVVRMELENRGIVSGIDEAAYKRAVKNQVYDTPIRVASAVLPIKGESGYITFRFDKEHKLKPHQNEFGIANYRELDSIIAIHKNDIIADITPPGKGIPGKNIFGDEIAPIPGDPAKITLGKNTLVTTDGTKVVAACDGHIVFGQGSFQVEEAVTVKTDLDLSVGNINFFGDVHIKGNVMEGFSINAGKNVKIDGSVFGGQITAGGDVTIVGGCINSKVTCDGKADIGFCENTEIFAKGDVVSKQFAFCNVFCYGGTTTKGPHGVISGGVITSMHDVKAGTIGSEKYTPTSVNIGDGSVLHMRKREAEADLAESVRIYDLAIKNLNFLKQRKSIQGQLTEAQQKQFRIETQNKLHHSIRQKELKELIDELEEDSKNRENLGVSCTGMIYPGVKFSINFLTLEIVENTPRSRITIIDNKLVAVPL